MLAKDDFTGGEKVLKAYAARKDVTNSAGEPDAGGLLHPRKNKPNMAEQALRDTR